jgi:non-specific serine/threonine protein kinase
MSAITLLHLLTHHNLRAYAGERVYRRGEEYYRLGRVRVDTVDEIEARCSVQGQRLYWVDLYVSHGDLGAMCTCPYADSGWFCKHMVAAGLAVHKHLQEYGASTWRLRLSNVLQGRAARRSPSPVKPYWLFLSLQQNGGSWELQPYSLEIEDVLEHLFTTNPDETCQNLPELIQHNPWIAQRIKAAHKPFTTDGCINCEGQAVSFANLLRKQQRYSPAYYSYTANINPLANYFAVLRHLDIPIYGGSHNQPVDEHLQINSAPGEIRLLLERSEQGINMQARFAVGEQRIPVSRDDLVMLTFEVPFWVAAGGQLFELEYPASSNLIYSWAVNPEVKIPPEGEVEFLENYFPSLVENYTIEGETVNWLDVVADPVKRLYLTDDLSTDSGKPGGELLAHLRFGYGDYEVIYALNLPQTSIQRSSSDAWTLARIQRNSQFEVETWNEVSSAYYGLKRSGSDYPPQVFLLRARVHPIDFLMRHVPRLTEAGFEIYGEEKLKSVRVNRNKPTLSLNISSGIDWFDLQASIKFGDVEATLKEVRAALRKKERYIKLADGTIGEIPDEWVERYKHLFGLAEQTDEGMRLSNHHLTLIDQLLADSDRHQVDAEFHRRRKRLLDFEGIQTRELPRGFVGELRPYQKAGFDWLHFLHEFEFGGCLADDMGLGKTIETLAFLQSLKESGHVKAATLLVLPRSLLINWQREAARFTPDLRLHLYFGQGRNSDLFDFKDYDLVLTTYGTMLRDVEWLRKYKFHYVVLDESQVVKNPLAKTAKAVRLLSSDHRLALTGTPVENSTFELWSQFAFLNPGLLGNLEYFKREISNPIEKQGDEVASEFLRKLVYPFILRRTKEQVAPELPPRTERLVFADMDPAQRKFYNKTRDYYRAMLVGMIEDEGINNARMKVLEGLLRLRQISNHPRLVKEDFRGDSAKFELLLETLETLHSEGHKALVFSQFVQMLKIVREALDTQNVPYVYLDGQTRKRQERVDQFQASPEIPFFLISLKAGGVGLNLTAADYVIHIDPWWNPAVEMQATDRTHRIGQDKPVFVYKLIARDTVEEKILQLQEKKRALVEQLITTESSFFKSLTVEDVEVLFS